MNFYWRQTIVGLLMQAATSVPALERRANFLAGELNRNLTSERLEEAFALFQEASSTTHDSIYVTGAYYAMEALDSVERFEEQARGPAGVTAGGDSYDVATGQGTSSRATDAAPRDYEQAQRRQEADQGFLELFDRIRAGATLEQALDLFPLLGEETNPA